jgi:hypothetical protein
MSYERLDKLVDTVLSPQHHVTIEELPDSPEQLDVWFTSRAAKIALNYMPYHYLVYQNPITMKKTIVIRTFLNNVHMEQSPVYLWKRDDCYRRINQNIKAAYEGWMRLSLEV